MAENETNDLVGTPVMPEVGSQGWAPLLPLASALGRSIGTVNSWGSDREGQLPKVTMDGEVLACVATAKHLHAHCAADREPTRREPDGRIYRSISALCSEVAMPHGTGLREARDRRDGEPTDFPDCFEEGCVTFCDADAFHGWAARQGYTRVTWSTLPVTWTVAPEAKTASPDIGGNLAERISGDKELRDLVTDLLEIASRLEDYRLSRKS